MKHTKDPWEARKRLVWANRLVIADCYRPGVPYEESCANAKLIASAPDLLEALEKIVNHWDNLHPEDRQQAVEVIEKARGDRYEKG